MKISFEQTITFNNKKTLENYFSTFPKCFPLEIHRIRITDSHTIQCKTIISSMNFKHLNPILYHVGINTVKVIQLQIEGQKNWYTKTVFNLRCPLWVCTVNYVIYSVTLQRKTIFTWKCLFLENLSWQFLIYCQPVTTQ